MASACVNNNVDVSQEFSAYGCFNPRASSSFSREDVRSSESKQKQVPVKEEPVSVGDFEFSLEDPVGMLPAEELFCEGKLVTKQQSTGGKCRRMEVEMEISGADSFLLSPKAPRCSSRWRELLGLKRFSQSTKSATTTSHSNTRSSTCSLKQVMHRSSRSSSSSDASLVSLPLLKDCSDCESLSISSSRMSLSSSSSGPDHEDTPRLSLDAERPNQNITANPFAPARSQNPNPPPRMRLVKPRDSSNHSAAGSGGRVGRSTMQCSVGGETCESTMSRGVSVDSPRLNSSGKIVFQSLERSSSSPSSFNGGTNGGYRQKGMERSYSGNVRVLNVPVCSVIFGQFFSPSQHNRTGSFSNNRASSLHHHGGISSRGRNSTDRI